MFPSQHVSYISLNLIYTNACICIARFRLLVVKVLHCEQGRVPEIESLTQSHHNLLV